MVSSLLDRRFLETAGIEIPLICGAMYPCSNPELIAAVSEAGGIGIIQPITLVFVHKYEFKKGLERIRALTTKPVGLNVLTEKSLSRVYRERMEHYIDDALGIGVRFFVTALGDPRWVVEKVKPAGGIVYHDVVDRRWAEKGLEGGVDGLICVNNRAGGHAGKKSARDLIDSIGSLGVPLICAGGVGNEKGFADALSMGYAGVQMGTRFIATNECQAHAEYKDAIVKANEADVVMTEKITGVPVSVLKTPYVERIGTTAGPLGRFLLQNHQTKHWMRAFYSLKSVLQLRSGLTKAGSHADYWQAGKSVAEIDAVEPVSAIMKRFAAAVS